MANFPTNYTISEVTYNNVASGSTVSSLHPTAVLLITPLAGYTLDSSQFSVQYPPPYTTSVVFTQSGLNVICTVNFSPTFVMPSNNVEIPLCINGMGELIQYVVDGYVYATGDANVISTPASGVGVPFSSAATLNTTVTVYTGEFTCNTGYYMPVPPVVVQNAGNPTGFTITYNDTYNIDGLLIAREYVITYLMPNYNNLDNNFSITASSVEIYVPELGITNYILSANTFPLDGGISILTLYGIEGSTWELTSIDPILQTGPIDPITGIIPYGVNASGIIDSSGQVTIQISVGPSVIEDSYSITLSGDISSLFIQPNPILLYQFGEVVVTYSLDTTTYFTNDGNKTNTGYGLSSPGIGDDGFSNDFYWNITALSDYGLILIQQPLTTDFTNQDPAFNGGTLLSIDSILATQTSGVSITLNATGSIVSYGINSFTSSLDLTKFIAYIDTTTPSAITAFTATSGGIVSYTGTGGTLGYKGLCYSINPSPTIADSVIQDTIGFGSFTSNMTQLIASTVYYVRAYSYNPSGIVFYGPEKTFTTEPEFPLTCTVGWDTTNLNVTTYRDGTAIPNVTNPTTWAALTTGAWRSVNDNPANDAVYGKLYNGYAVAGIYDAASLANPALRKNLAPIGRVIPESTDVITLIDCLGGPSQAGGKMKEAGTTHWNSPNVDATNSSNFTSLPAGFMSPYQNSFGDMAYFWTATEGSASNLAKYFRNIGLSKTCLYPTEISRSNGMSVRTIPAPPSPDEACVVGFSSANLNVTTYNDGTPLVDGSALSNAAWAALTEGAWCYPDGNPANAAVYGRIYNWYAAAGVYDGASLTNPALRKNIAPVGSHVPSIAEWDAAITCLGGISTAAGKLKETGFAHWLSPNTGATNSSGFTGLPGGIRLNSGFSGLGTQGNFYAKDKPDPTHARYYGIFNTGTGIGTNNNPEYIGCSIRTKID